MRFIHTSDWHLGRIFYGVHLTNDQAYVLNQLCDIIKDSKPDVLLISGDVYDRSIPPPESVRLLDEILSRVVIGLKVPVVIIAGNHDSPERLGFASQFLADQGLYIFGPFNNFFSPVKILDNTGPVYIYAAPYAEPPIAREVFQDNNISDQDKVIRTITNMMKSNHPAGCRSILMAHSFVTGGEASESERPLSIGGIETVSSSHFDWFNYVALGHLHRPQSIGNSSIQYPGSILKYSFSEEDHVKSVTIVEMDAMGRCKVERMPLVPRRDVRQIKGFLNDLLIDDSIENKEDYFEVTLLDEGAVLDPMGRLREVYPNVLSIKRPKFDNNSPVQCRSDHRKMSEVELFSDFFKQTTGQEINDDQRTTFSSAVEILLKKDRET